MFLSFQPYSLAVLFFILAGWICSVSSPPACIPCPALPHPPVDRYWLVRTTALYLFPGRQRHDWCQQALMETVKQGHPESCTRPREKDRGRPRLAKTARCPLTEGTTPGIHARREKYAAEHQLAHRQAVSCSRAVIGQDGGCASPTSGR